MKPKCTLPVLLVSACDMATAEEFISELIDNEVTETERDEEMGGSMDIGAGRVWRLVNKYYCADVLVRASGDSDPPSDHNGRVEAHVVYFTPEECEMAMESAVAYAERRVCIQASVRVAALRVMCEGALGEWAVRARYEPVLLQQQEEGVARVREALQAHPWPGLLRLDRAVCTLSHRDSENLSSSGEEEEEEEEMMEDGDEGDVERAEQFALALGALGEAGAGAGALGDAERRERAEQLLAAFCRALGHRLDC